ncbi:MAG: Hsp20/alpha crystallin family protein, partial [Candidatus Margulisbacteria bacterium]|nr:Hsp20/alpha crystallin family protein [Candidatus Margulisiibacteriota bacterium]
MDNEINVFLNNKFDKDFFGSNTDPFKEMVSQQKALRKAIKNDLQKSLFDDQFNAWSRDKFGIMDVDYQIKQEETTKDKILVITFSKDYDAKNVTVGIKENIISLEGTVQEQLAKENGAEKKSEKLWSYSHFLRQFPVPEKVDAASAQISREKNKVVIKFVKS